MTADLYKVCPECGGEFQHTVATCVDCGVPLVFPEEIAARDARELALAPGMIPLRTAPILWLRALAADLARAGIPYAVDRRQARDKGVLALYVRRRDREAAAKLDIARQRIEPLSEAEEPAEIGRKDEDDVAEPAYKVCPQCGGEYRLDIARCADCGVELVAPREKDASGDLMGEEEPWEQQEEAFAYSLEPPRHELPASDDLVCFCCMSFPTLASLSATLDAAGIGHRIERGPYERSSTRGCLYLLPMDCDAAERLWESPQEVVEDVTAALRACPACGASLARGASACSDCGLELSAAEAACPACGALLAFSETDCPNCGSAIARA